MISPARRSTRSLRRLHEPLGGCRGTTGPFTDRPGDRPAVGAGLPRDHRRGHGADRACVAERTWYRPAGRGGLLLAGRMQAFEWAILFPDQVDAVASTHALHPQGVAWNAIARAAIIGDPAWRGGRSATADGRHTGCRDGRGADGRPHHLPVRTGAGRQVRLLVVRRRYPLHDHQPEFEVESYLRHQADEWRFDANTYLYTSRALTYFDLARQHGRGSLTQALEGIWRARC